MNYYQYKRRAPKRSGGDYIKPFIVIIIFIGIIVAGWNLLSSVLIGDNVSLSNEKVFLDIETGGAKAMTAADSAWKNVPTSIYLYEGERVKTQSDGRVTLDFFDETTARLDKSSEVLLESLKQEGNSGRIELKLEEGKLWASVDSATGMRTDLTLHTDLIDLTTSQGTVSVTYPGTVYVLTGSAMVNIYNGKEIVKTVTVGVGQQLVVDDKVAADLGEDLTKEILFALDDSFKTSNWYRWNRQKDGLGELDEDEAEEEESTEEESEESEGETEEEEVEEEEEELTEEEKEELANDKEPPTKPVIEVPGAEGESVTLEDVEQDITGSVSEDTEAVIVNDYRLSLYKPGSGEFKYFAKVAYGNLKVGENEFEVIAEDKAGNQSEAAKITLVLPEEVADEAKEEEEETVEEDTTPAEASSSGGVKLTGPNGGENFSTSETEFDITGEVPEGTSKVVVNDYQLQGFSEGDTTFLYRAKSSLGTLTIGELNTYTAKAYDEDDELIGTASMTIDVESGSNGEGAPVITIPTTIGSYTTTLNELVIAGSVGKWITRVRVDGANIDSYIPGSEEWSTTVTLDAGENAFEICAEKAGESQGCSTITITYQN